VVGYRYYFGDCLTAETLGELPFMPTDAFTRLLCDAGAFSGEIPLDHEVATRVNFKQRMTNLIVVRNGFVKWWGPVEAVTPNLDGRTMTLNARTPSWWMQHRCIEENKHYNADSHSIFRKMWTYVTTKTDDTAGDINAALPNISVSSGLSGNTVDLPIAGSGRYFMYDLVHDWLVDDPDTGLEYREDFSGTVDNPTCVITLGSPLGTTLSGVMTEHSLTDYGEPMSFGEAVTRPHAVGAGTAVATRQNTGSITDGFPLLDGVLDRTDISSLAALVKIAREYRRKGQPPVRTPDAEFTPTPNGLDFDYANLGDKVPFGTSTPDLLRIVASQRRVTEIAVTPPTGEEKESVAYTCNLPLESLGE